MKKTELQIQKEYREARDRVTREMQDVIFKNAFKQKTFPYPLKPNETEPEIFKVPTMIYVLDKARKNPIEIGWRNDIPDLHDLLFKTRDFSRNLSLIIWDCKHQQDPEWRKTFFAEVERGYCSKAKRFCEKEKYDKRTTHKILKIVKGHAREQIAKLRKNEGNEFDCNPYAHYWIARENVAINQIQGLYNQTFAYMSEKKRHLCLNDRKIIFSMAIVFAATNFWSDRKDDPCRLQVYSERIKKRLQAINKVIQEDIEDKEDSL